MRQDFTDKVSGKLAARPELDKALAYLRAGDVLVITRLSRAMRSVGLSVASHCGHNEIGMLYALKAAFIASTATEIPICLERKTND